VIARKPDSHPDPGRAGPLGRLMSRLGDALRPSEALDPILEEQFNRLRHSVMHHPTVKGVRSILVTSAVEGEGKTSVAVGLARSFARALEGAAILIETDLRRPTLARRFELLPNPGLIGCIIDGKPLAKVVQETQIPKLSVVQAGGRLDAAANLIGSSYMRHFARQLHAAYPERIVIYDAPPLLATPEPLSLSLIADAVLFVIRAETTSRFLVRQALRALPPEKLLGLALNCLPLGASERRTFGSWYSDFGSEVEIR
jgi:Mrp family chromosome partitioning ATPase